MGRESRRLNREDWLEGGLRSLSEEGLSGLRTERLATKLGVTTGSFYWHFQGRGEFERQLLDHWAEQMTLHLMAEMERTGLPARERLYGSFVRITRERLARYETPIRAWALISPRARETVAHVDQVRLEFIRGTLREMGFEGDQLDMRARVLLLYVMAEPSFFLDDSDEDRARWLDLRFELLTAS